MSSGGVEKVRFGVGLVSLIFALAILWLGLWAVAAPPVFGWSPVAVMSGSMAPRIETGDVVLVAPYEGGMLDLGAVIVFEDPASEGRVTHRVVDVTPTGHYVTRGDANGRLDSTAVAPEEIVGVGRLLVPVAAKPLVWADRGEWVLVVLFVLATGSAVWTSRWALLDRYDPWSADSDVEPLVLRPRSAGDITPYVVVVALSLVILAFTTTRSRSVFADFSDNAANVIGADILQPPIALTATGGGSVTLNWTITPDTYATGHRVYRSATPGGPYSQIAQITPRATATYLDSPAAGAYYYVVRAYTTNWESANSNEDNATVGGAEDYDAIPAGSDNCPATFNIDQYDTDGDTIGDSCDASPTVASAGTFTDSGQTLGTANSRGVAFGDVDGDGDLDAVFVNNAQPNTVWLNNGTGTFTDSGQTLGTAISYAVILGDVDGDADLDAMVSNLGEPNTVWLNNGTGTFTDSGQTLGTALSRAAAFGDVDGDGDLDAMVAKNDDPSTVWLNDGTGTFTDSGQTLGTALSRTVSFGDVDGDGDLDAMIGNFAAPNTVWFNDGTGTFTDSGQTLGALKSVWVAFGDVDGDGDLDAMVANQGEANTVWLNNGSGTFSDSGQTLGTAPSRTVSFGDVDGDGDLDAMIANNGQNIVWLNS